MVRYLYETVCPHGYVKNGYDKNKLVEYMKNIQVKHKDTTSFNLDHICKEKKESRRITFECFISLKYVNLVLIIFFLF